MTKNKPRTETTTTTKTETTTRIGGGDLSPKPCGPLGTQSAGESKASLVGDRVRLRDRVEIGFRFRVKFRGRDRV